MRLLRRLALMRTLGADLDISRAQAEMERGYLRMWGRGERGERGRGRWLGMVGVRGRGPCGLGVMVGAWWLGAVIWHACVHAYVLVVAFGGQTHAANPALVPRPSPLQVVWPHSGLGAGGRRRRAGSPERERLQAVRGGVVGGVGSTIFQHDTGSWGGEGLRPWPNAWQHGRMLLRRVSTKTCVLYLPCIV